MTADAPAAAPPPLDHEEARARWGLPDECEGSVNQPGTREEHGIRFNERWVYFLPDGRRRLVYWYRYAWRGALVEAPDGSVSRESS